MPKPADSLHPQCARIRREQRHARILGLAVAGSGLLSLVSALTPELRARLHFLTTAVTPQLILGAKATAALLGVALLLLGRGIVHRRRLAYLGAVVLLVVSAVSQLLKGLDIEEAVVILVVAGFLVRARRLFDARVPPARWRALARAIPLLLLVGLAYGMLGYAIRMHHARPEYTPWLAARTVVARLAGLTGPLHLTGYFGQWFPASITALGAAGVVVVVWLALAPVAEQAVAIAQHAARQRARVRLLTSRTDGDTLDPFALRRDKSYVLSSDGLAAIAYRYVNGVGLASGDPVGDPASFDDAIARFVEHCAQRGWRPAFVGVRGDRLGHYEQAGLRAHYLGEEAVIDVASFDLEGRRMRPVRQAVNRTKNHGLVTEVHREGELDPTLRRALVGIAERHRDGAPERGFSMALDDLLSGRDPECVVAVCRDADGTPIAFQRFVPCRAGRGLSLDAMRRDRVGPNGVNERLIVECVAWARDHGIDRISLNFATFKGLIDDGASRSGMQRVEAWFVRRLDPRFQIRSLLTFNAKFHPNWVPRYVAYRSAGDLAAVGLAYASAEAFLPFDRKRPSEVEAPGDDGRRRDPIGAPV